MCRKTTHWQVHWLSPVSADYQSPTILHNTTAKASIFQPLFGLFSGIDAVLGSYYIMVVMYLSLQEAACVSTNDVAVMI